MNFNAREIRELLKQIEIQYQIEVFDFDKVEESLQNLIDSDFENIDLYDTIQTVQLLSLVVNDWLELHNSLAETKIEKRLK